MNFSPRITQFASLQDYGFIYNQMREFTHQRTIDTPDVVWLLEHYPVFTQGQAGKQEHILDPKSIPIVQSDRGGQVTYHGPGQLMVYTMVDLKRHGFNIRQFVSLLEETVINLLKGYDIVSEAKADAPGVYVEGAKICSIGLRVRHGRTYHGLSLNVNMDLTPFTWINPCGFSQLKMTQISDFIPDITLTRVIDDLLSLLIPRLTCSEMHYEQ